MDNRATANLKKLVLSAVFLSLSLSIQFVFPNFYIPLFGQDGIKIGFSGIFSIMPSILFGPLYGAITSGLSDLLGYLLRPSGAYLPQMTLIIALGGAIRGFTWLFLKKRNEKTIRIAVIALTVLMAAFGLWSIFSLSADGISSTFYDTNSIESIRTEGMQPISCLLIDRTISASDPGKSLPSYITMVTAVPLGFAGFAALLFPIDYFIRKKLLLENHQGYLLQILIAMLTSGMIVTTLNTLVLRDFVFSSWKNIPFFALWLPRAIEEIISNTIKVYFVAFFYGLFLKQPMLKKNFLPEKSERTSTNEEDF